MSFRNLPLVPALCLLPGCYSVSRFQDDQAAAMCHLFQECDLLDTVGAKNYKDCYAEMSKSNLQCEDFDSTAASDCVDGWEKLSCARLDEGYNPKSCDEVCSSTVKVD